MIALELACAGIVVTYVTLRLRRADDAAHVAQRLMLLAVAGFIGEDTVIRAYGAYTYTPAWSFFLDRVPLLIVLIWPVVVDSAGELARHLTPRASAVPFVGAAIVLADAALIEPIAVHSKLWTWSARGLFDVPAIGVLGWGFFAGSAIAWLDRRRRALVLVVAPLATHALILLAWWVAFKWVRASPTPWVGVAIAWCVLALVTAFARTRRAPFAALTMRLPGAIFFFALLAVTARDDAPLVVWSLAFAMPYLVLLHHCEDRDYLFRTAISSSRVTRRTRSR